MQLYFGTPITRYIYFLYIIIFLDLQIYNSGTLEMAVEDIRNRTQKPVLCQHASHTQNLRTGKKEIVHPSLPSKTYQA